jgi:hypothetical protein
VGLVSSSRTYFQGCIGDAGNDTAIANQITFSSTGNYSSVGAIVLDGTPDNKGKSSIKFYGADDGTPLALGTALNDFSAKFRWFVPWAAALVLLHRP